MQSLFCPNVRLPFPEFRAHRRGAQATTLSMPLLGPRLSISAPSRNVLLFSHPGRSLQHRSTVRRTTAVPASFVSGFAYPCTVCGPRKSPPVRCESSDPIYSVKVCQFRARCHQADHGARAGHIAKFSKTYGHAMSQVPFIFLPFVSLSEWTDTVAVLVPGSPPRPRSTPLTVSYPELSSSPMLGYLLHPAEITSH